SACALPIYDQLNVHVDVVTWHNHFRAFWQGHDARHVRGTEVELGTVVAEERGMTTAFFLGEDIGLSNEVGVRGHGTGLAENLTALNLSTIDTADQCTNVVASLARVEQLAEHFDTGNGGLLGWLDADDFDFFTDLDDAAF